MNIVTQDAAEVYHANREYIGSTELREMALSPKHFYTAWKGPKKEESTEAMDIGTLLHSLLLEQDIERFVARPVKADGEMVRANSKEYKEFLAANPGKTPIRKELFDDLYTALTAFTENQTAMKMIEKARIEHSVYAVCPYTQVKVKCRPDVWGSGYMVDLKSTGTLDDAFIKNIFNNGYDFQLAHYVETILAATGEVIENVYILGFEKAPPYASRVYEIPMMYIREAKDIRHQYLNEISICLQDNKWPGYHQEIIKVERPRWMEKQNEVSFGGVSL